jgi:Family of unknown function (DUF6158)
MDRIETLLDAVYPQTEPAGLGELQRRAVAADLPLRYLTALERLPDGEYARRDVLAAFEEVRLPEAQPGRGVPAGQLTDDDLLRELTELHRTRTDAVRYGSDHALDRHTGRTAELEKEYLRRFPGREIDPERMRAGARQRHTPLAAGPVGSRPPAEA